MSRRCAQSTTPTAWADACYLPSSLTYDPPACFLIFIVCRMLIKTFLSLSDCTAFFHEVLPLNATYMVRQRNDSLSWLSRGQTDARQNMNNKYLIPSSRTHITMSYQSLIGKPAPPITLKNYDGQDYTFTPGATGLPTALFFYPESGTFYEP